MNAQRVASVGEDATRIIGRVDNDIATNRCVGVVLPLDDHSLPLVDSFLATSFTAIEQLLDMHTSIYGTAIRG